VPEILMASGDWVKGVEKYLVLDVVLPLLPPLAHSLGCLEYKTTRVGGSMSGYCRKRVSVAKRE
jgi:hypothetical protein